MHLLKLGQVFNIFAKKKGPRENNYYTHIVDMLVENSGNIEEHCYDGKEWGYLIYSYNHDIGSEYKENEIDDYRQKPPYYFVTKTKVLFNGKDVSISAL